MNYLIIDLEATCFQIKSGTEEIIEIGAVLVDEWGDISDEFQSFVKPIRNPELSWFCRKLTHITQRDVAMAPKFPEVMCKLRNWLGNREYIFCSWGDYDRKQFKHDCEFHGVEYPFGEKHINLKELFRKSLSHKRMGVSTALDFLGFQFEGSPHRGIDDAKNIARIFKKISQTEVMKYEYFKVGV